LSDPAVNQGYTADGAEGVGDHKECYEHRRFRNELCPTKSDLADFNILKLQSFRETLDEFYMKCFTLSQRVLKCLAIAMKLPGGEDFFTNITKHADPQMRLLHYPPVPASLITLPGESLGEGKEGRIMPHTDFGFCTLLFQDNAGGLEVDPFHTGNFIQAKPIPGTVLINIGDLLHRLLNGRVKSTIHRVVSPPDRTIGESGEAMLPPRYSIPYFVHPDPDTTIDPIILAEGERKLFAAVNAGKWRDWNTAKNYGMKGQEELLKNSMTAVVG
jgi:isopenicillin N synthase-like dioxygenase